MLPEKAQEIVEHTQGSLGSVPLPLVCGRYGETNFDLARIVGTEVRPQVPDELAGLPATNCELEPCAGGVEDVGLKFGDEPFNVSK